MRVALVAVLVAGAVLRIAWAAVAPEEPEWDPVPSDPGWYLFIGDMVSEGEGYSYVVDEDFETQATGYYPPGYPLVLGGVFWLTDALPGDVSDLDAAVALNVLLSVATIALVFELGRRVVNARVGLAAAGVMALWPNLVFHSGVVLTETLTLFLLVALFLVVLASAGVARSPGRWRLLTVGALFGMVGLVRPTSLVFAPVFLFFWLPSGARKAIGRTALVAAATFAVILPWTARNWVQLGEPVLISTNTGDNLCIGYNPDATGSYGDPGDYCLGGISTHDPAVESRGEYDVRRQSETMERAWETIKDNPQRIFTLMPSRLRSTLWDDADGLAAANDYGRRSKAELLNDPERSVEPLFSDSTRDLLRGGANLFYLGALAVTAVGSWLVVKRWRAGRGDPAGRLGFLGAAALLQLVSPLLTFGDARFKMPIYPTMAVFAGVALVVVAWAGHILFRLLVQVVRSGVVGASRWRTGSVLFKLLVQAIRAGALSRWEGELAPDLVAAGGVTAGGNGADRDGAVSVEAGDSDQPASPVP